MWAIGEGRVPARGKLRIAVESFFVDNRVPACRKNVVERGLDSKTFRSSEMRIICNNVNKDFIRVDGKFKLNPSIDFIDVRAWWAPSMHSYVSISHRYVESLADFWKIS